MRPLTLYFVQYPYLYASFWCELTGHMESAATHRDLLADYAIEKDITFNEVHCPESWKGARDINK